MIAGGSIPALDLSVYDVLKKTSQELPDNIAYEYLGHSETYRSFVEQVDVLSLHLRKMGVRQGDKVIICLPNCPQALISFYALSRLGAISVMVHPLSSKSEIEFFIKDSGSKIAVTLARFADNFPEVDSIEGFDTLIVASPVDMMPALSRGLAKLFSKESRMPKGPLGPGRITWKDMMKQDVGQVDQSMPHIAADDPASILYTGGTTGRNKGAVHSSTSFNSTSMGMIELSGVLGEGTTMLANMPMFHGFGLCTCVHLPVCIGLRIILVPTFTLESLADIITKKQVNYLAGVPTLFEKLFVDEYLRNKDLSFIKGIFCGGDSISIDSKARIDKFLKDHGCGTFIRLGYGCTECLTATAITPKFEERPGSVGVPIPGFAFKIADVETAAEVPDGETGEICINGPSVMMEYYNNPEETAMTLKTHDDGKVWLHTGDVGIIKDGFIYFTNRIKRIIITSGYNVYPSQIEHVLNQHPYVDSSCVIGVPDPLRGTKVKAVLVLKPGIEQSDEVMDSISQYVKETTSAYAKPREYEVVDSLPRTKLGKVDYRALEAKECGTEDQKQ